MKINTLGKLAARYFSKNYLSGGLFHPDSRVILAGEILKPLGSEKILEEDLIKGFVRASHFNTHREGNPGD